MVWWDEKTRNTHSGLQNVKKMARKCWKNVGAAKYSFVRLKRCVVFYDGGVGKMERWDPKIGCACD
jgi:hypothetical protein